MTSPRALRWFQMHLATALVLMLLLGVMLCLNLPPVRRLVHLGVTGRVDQYGWPAYVVSCFPQADNVVSLRESADRLGRPVYEFYEVDREVSYPSFNWRSWPRQPWSTSHLCVDIGVTAAVLLVAAFLSEFILRRGTHS